MLLALLYIVVGLLVGNIQYWKCVDDKLLEKYQATESKSLQFQFVMVFVILWPALLIKFMLGMGK